ncbi:chitin deacetylase 7-like [Babylonia areolata]|uniref:chitin deacetylase 7-like n=1 Tax=Babylonia areolata TaxID=304850 RepID=UPI003FD0317D
MVHHHTTTTTTTTTSTALFLLLPLVLTSLVPWADSQTTQCRAGENCKAPDCRCWNDDSTPGSIPMKDTPQVVLVTFQYAVNSGNADQYKSLFSDLVNPNNCPAVGTFFVQQTNTDMAVVKGLADNGHEIAVTTADGTLPDTEKQWMDSIKAVRKALIGAGVPEQTILGVRAPNLRPGGLNEFMALAQEKFLYDASCSTGGTDSEQAQLWPYTYDFAPGPKCDNGDSPQQEFPGKWQVLVADLEFNGTKCASPAACTNIATQRDAFDLFYTSFIKHYEGSRSPFMMVINPEWVMVDYKREGTYQFLEYVRAAFEDTWILTVTQALEWVRNPVPNANATADYGPWNCTP